MFFQTLFSSTELSESDEDLSYAGGYGTAPQKTDSSTARSPAKPRARGTRVATDSCCHEQLWVWSVLLQLVTLTSRKAKSGAKSANTWLVPNKAASSDRSCQHFNEKKRSKNASEVNSFSFWCKDGTAFQNNSLNTEFNLNKKRARRFYSKARQKDLGTDAQLRAWDGC